MTSDIRDTVKEINGLIRKELWFDFHVFKYDGRSLTIAGGPDLCYYHQLEIIFENVFFFHGFFAEWKSDTSQPVFVLPDNEVQLSLQFEIEEGYMLFMFRTEDCENDVIIAAEKISYNTDTVFYYLRENLGDNERIADFVKR
jgi:hypothetical protein